MMTPDSAQRSHGICIDDWWLVCTNEARTILQRSVNLPPEKVRVPWHAEHLPSQGDWTPFQVTQCLSASLFLPWYSAVRLGKLQGLLLWRYQSLCFWSCWNLLLWEWLSMRPYDYVIPFACPKNLSIDKLALITYWSRLSHTWKVMRSCACSRSSSEPSCMHSNVASSSMQDLL